MQHLVVYGEKCNSISLWHRWKCVDLYWTESIPRMYFCVLIFRVLRTKVIVLANRFKSLLLSATNKHFLSTFCNQLHLCHASLFVLNFSKRVVTLKEIRDKNCKKNGKWLTPFQHTTMVVEINGVVIPDLDMTLDYRCTFSQLKRLCILWEVGIQSTLC